MTTPTPRLVLIEPYADRVGGHYRRTLAAVADAAPGAVIITPAAVTGWSARMLTCCAAGVQALAVFGSWVLPSRRWPDRLRRIPHQLGLVRRCLIEAACLRTVIRRSSSGPVAVVILTASEGLHVLAAVLGGVPHLRFVHEVNTTEDLPLRLLAALCRCGESRVGLLCPTEAVRRQVTARFPRLAAMVSTYAVDDGQRLTDAEISGARAVFGIADDATVVCLAGGWWAHKDVATVDAALTRIRRPLHLLVTGDPVDHSLLVRWRHLPQVRLHVESGPLPERALRLVYAAATASLVARQAGVGKESGLVLDAARLGVPLIVSDHDPDLSGQLAGQDWVRMFPAADATGLAAVLDRLSDTQPPRPPVSAPKTLGMSTAAEQAAFLTDTATTLLNRGVRR